MAEKISRTRLFKGFSSIDATTPTTEMVDIELIKRDLLNHFQTIKGERLMRPDYGSIIHELLFDPFDEMVKEAIISDARSIIEQETRVQIRSMDVFEFEQGLRLDIEVLYIPFNVLETFEISFDKRNDIQDSTTN